VQSSVPDAQRGRAFALLYAAGDAATAAGIAAAGLAIGLVGARALWLATAAVLALAATGAPPFPIRVTGKEGRRRVPPQRP